MIKYKVVPKFGILLLAAFLLNFKGSTSAKTGFEGIIHFNIPELKSEIGTSNLQYMIKKDMIRIEYKSDADNKTSLVYGIKNKTMFINLSSLGGYVEVAPDDVKKNITHSRVHFTSTNETKKVAGRPCKISKAVIDGATYQYCFARGMGEFILPVNSMTSGKVPKWAGLQFPENQMPLQVVRVQKGGKNKPVLITTKIEPKELDRNLFSVLDRN